MSGEHAHLSPSKSECWLHCAASPALTPPGRDSGSIYADEGTAAHELAAKARLASMPAVTFIIEQRVPIDRWTREKNAKGTSDTVIIRGDELIIDDFKYGMGVKVFAEKNSQLMIYALGTLDLFAELLDGIKNVRLCIDQPRLGHFDEWALSLEDLLAFGKTVQEASDRVEVATATRDQWKDDATSIYYAPGTETCRWCPLKATCPALAAHVEKEIGAGFEDLTKLPAEDLLKVSDADLSKRMFAIELIQDWCNAFRAHVEAHMLAGNPVPGWKVVQGKRGNRKFSDENEVIAALKAARLSNDEIYEKSLISPTTAEKLFEKPRPKIWQKLQSFITQADGKLGIAPTTDERPAIEVTPTIDEFPDHTKEGVTP